MCDQRIFVKQRGKGVGGHIFLFQLKALQVYEENLLSLM